MARLLFVILLCCYSGLSARPLEPVRSLSTDGHFIRLNGKLTLLVGDSVTQGWMELGGNFDWKAYLDKLSRNKCNVVMLWSYIGITDQPGDKRIGYDAPEIWPWQKTGNTFNLAKKNPEYFSRLREFAQYAQKKGIVVIITIHDGWTKTRFAGHPFNAVLGGPLSRREQYIDFQDYYAEMPDQFDQSWSQLQKNQFYQEIFCKWLIDAVGKYPNVIFEIFNEGEWYDSQKLDMYETHFLRFIKKRTKCLTMINERSDLHDNPDCDIFSLHQPNWSKDTVITHSFNLFTNELRANPSKPLFFSEPVPEYGGDRSMNRGLMRLMWGTVLSGSSFVVQNDCSFAFDKSSAMSSKIIERDIIYLLEGHCARFMDSIDLCGMIPNGELASSGVCLASPGREYVIYSQKRMVEIDLSSLKGTCSYRYFDPATGITSNWREIEGGGKVLQDTGSNNDMIIHIKSGAIR
ncbi:MAG: cellulase family glycosylhydrolase [Armatimonadota bacterium]